MHTHTSNKNFKTAIIFIKDIKSSLWMLSKKIFYKFFRRYRNALWCIEQKEIQGDKYYNFKMVVFLQLFLRVCILKYNFHFLAVVVVVPGSCKADKSSISSSVMKPDFLSQLSSKFLRNSTIVWAIQYHFLLHIFEIRMVQDKWSPQKMGLNPRRSGLESSALTTRLQLLAL